MNVRRNSKQRVRPGTVDPSHPSIGGTVISSSILKVPVSTRVGEVAEGVVGGDSVATPSRNGDTEMLNVGSTGWEVDAIDEVGYWM